MNPSLEETVTFDFITSSPTTGAAADADSTPSFEVFENVTDTALTLSGATIAKRTSKTGNYRATFTVAAADGFEAGKSYNVVASATVGGVAGKAVVGRFVARTRDTDDLMATYTQPTGFLAATFPGTVASTTNITAGTITTVTNLTNAPTAGDFTSTMKTSIGTAVAASAVASVTGAVTLTSAYDFAKGTVAVAESYAANGAVPTPVQALLAIHQYLMDFTIGTTNYTVKKLNNSTTAFVVTLNDSVSPTAASRT